MGECFECKKQKQTMPMRFKSGTFQLCQDCREGLEKARKERNYYIETEGVEK